MESQPPAAQPPRYPGPSHLSGPPPVHLSHAMSPHYALAPPPLPMALPIPPVPMPMPLPHAPPHHHHPHPPPPHHGPPPHTLLHADATMHDRHEPLPGLSAHPGPSAHLPSLAAHPAVALPGRPTQRGMHQHHVPPTHVGPYYDGGYAAATKVARLEAELDKARGEVERLRLKLSEYEKDRLKSDSPKVQSRYWTPHEHRRFLEALQNFGPKDVRAIASYVGSRNATQVRTHAQKYFLRVAREAKHGSALQSARKRSMSESDLARVGRSVRTPPGSPTMRDGRAPALFPPTSLPVDAQMTGADLHTQLPQHAPLPPASALAQPPTQPPPSASMPMQASQPSAQPPPNSLSQLQAAFAPPPSMHISPEPVASAARPPAAGLVTTRGKPPVASSNMADNTGINLLSLVASEKKMEAEKER